MDIISIIERKRDKKELSKEEIEYFINEYTKGKIEDYQAEESPNESNIFNYNNLYENYIWKIKLKDRLPNNSLKLKS